MLTEGGANAHLSHVWESGDLSFNELDNIFTSIFSGKIELREKVDGFAFTVTMRDGVLYSARNKTELKNPLNFEQTVQKFSDRSETIKNAFITSFTDMNNALQALSSEEQKDIFGPNGENFLSFEIVSPGARNLINYGDKAIIILHGINIFNDNWEKQSDDPAKAKKLYEYFKKHNVLNQQTYEIQGPVVLKIKKSIKSQDALKEIKRDIDDILGGLPTSITILEYVIRKIKPKLQEIAINSGLGEVMSDTVVADLISRTNNKLGLKQTKVIDLIAHIADGTVSQVSKDTIKIFIKDVADDVSVLIDQAILPIWMLVVKAGTLLIKSLSGFISADQSATAKDLTAQLDDIVNTDVKAQLSPNNLSRFTKTLMQLDKFNREILGTEGIVFTYNNKLYKLTSTFGPLNQLLGLFYKVSLNKNQTETIEETTTEVNENRIDNIQSVAHEFNPNYHYVVYIPGSFKPPHTGHINLIKAYANKNFGIDTTLKVIVSAPKKVKRLLSTGQEITAEAAADALHFILDKVGLRDIEIFIDQNPVKRLMTDIIEHADKFKKTAIIIGMSDKDNINKYNNIINTAIQYMFDNDINQKPGEQTVFVDPSITMVDAIKINDKNVNATDLRLVLSDIIKSIDSISDEQIVKMLKPFLPRTLSDIDILTYFNKLNLK